MLARKTDITCEHAITFPTGKVLIKAVGGKLVGSW
jgi:hypothetical protein